MRCAWRREACSVIPGCEKAQNTIKLNISAAQRNFNFITDNMKKLILLRHGESTWNKENRFTGWTDVDLSATGMEEARHAGRLLRESGFAFDVAYTSVLKRAIRTLWIVLDELDQMWIPVHLSWRLNERHYGALQGLNKVETALRYGEEQVLIWRRSYNTRPPALTLEDPRYPGFDPRYRDLSIQDIPLAECLADTVTEISPLLEPNYCASGTIRAACAHYCSRQFLASAGHVSRQPFRARGHGIEYPYRRSACI